MSDLVAFKVMWGGYLVHLFVIHDNVLSISVSVIKQSVKFNFFILGMQFRMPC